MVRIDLAQNSWPYELRNKKFFCNFIKSWSKRYCSQCFMIGIISAVFHGVGSCCSLKLLLKIEHTGWARTSAYSFKTQFETPSGPEAFLGLRVQALYKYLVVRVGHGEQSHLSRCFSRQLKRILLILFRDIFFGNINVIASR